jgi:RNA polymerase sigma-70 factor (ECF subfamily)
LYLGRVSTSESQFCADSVIKMKWGGSSRMNTSSATQARRQRFDRVVGVFHLDMYRYAAWLCRDKAIAEDVVQEALLRAWKSLDALRDDEAAKPWLLTIVRRENARYFERRRLETVDIDNLTASQAALLAEEPSDELDELREAIYELEDDYREPLVLQVLMGYSTNEIAELMELKQGAVLTRLHRARHKLREVMEDQAVE